MAISYQILLIILPKEFIKIKVDCDWFPEYESVNGNLIKHKCFNKDYSNKLDEKLNEKFKNTFKFSNNYINKFILLLSKGVYHYEYMDDWESV